MGRLPAALVEPRPAERRRLLATGLVQGVGFRPFVYRLAAEHGLAGWVRNTPAGVEIEVEGAADGVRRFVERLGPEAPALARVERLTWERLPPVGEAGFRIVATRAAGDGSLPVGADAATCAACLAEVLDPAARRHGYPFTNCTACGPRFTVIEALPYDRERTSMRVFPMCDACRAEYLDPADRRFHAEPIACPECGPRLELVRAGRRLSGDPLEGAARALLRGRIVAVKGIGGFQLACLAGSERAVARLRRRKARPDKPFAVMVADLPAARRLCRVDEPEAALLLGPRAPIVLLRRRADPEDPLAPSLAPGLDTLGVMLPPTPLHHLLLRRVRVPLVMTSGNRSEEPIAVDNEEALERLGDIADAWLLHDRAVVSRYDDSVARVEAGAAQLLRRARGYAPEPIRLPAPAPVPILATGAQLKSTFCLVRGDRAFVSQHLGDLDEALTLGHYLRTLELYRALFGITPGAVAFDLHPDGAGARLAAAHPDVATIGVQHHHAHLAACLAEHGIRDPAIGVAFDGAGYGTDGAVWGGELMVADWRGFHRVAHLRYLPLPGGDAAAREPWRMATAALADAFGAEAGDRVDRWLARVPAERRRAVLRLAGTARIGVRTSSAGRLFDAVAALAGVRDRNGYEGQAAAELEACADAAEGGSYPLPLEPAADADAPAQWDVRPLVRAVVQDLERGAGAGRVAARFHAALVGAVAEGCALARARTGLDLVALSGGCFQNLRLSEGVRRRLERDGFRVLTHRRVPPNDGGISLGQAAVALATLQR